MTSIRDKKQRQKLVCPEEFIDILRTMEKSLLTSLELIFPSPKAAKTFRGQFYYWKKIGAFEENLFTGEFGNIASSGMRLDPETSNLLVTCTFYKGETEPD